MTIQEIREQASEQPVDVELVEETDPVAGTLRHYVHQERTQADRFAQEAATHRQRANTLEDRAMACRAREQRYQRLLLLVEAEAQAGQDGEPINEQGDVQTILFRRPIYPLAHSGEGRVFLTCTRCGRPTREATREEVQEVEAGLAVRNECEHCQKSPRTLPYPPVSPDAA